MVDLAYGRAKGKFQKCFGPLSAHTWKSFQKLFQAIASLQMVDQTLCSYTRACEAKHSWYPDLLIQCLLISLLIPLTYRQHVALAFSTLDYSLRR